MSVNIADQITATWPTTEAKLRADSDVGYDSNKLLAIERAKHDLYGSATVPAEASIPDDAAYWIADKAVVRLIPLAKDFFRINRRLSDSKEGANISYYNLADELEKLRLELESSLASAYDSVRTTIAAADADDASPAVSVSGLLVDPTWRAWRMGVP